MYTTRAMMAVAALTAGVATMAAPIPAKTGLVVHEWGTFSSFSGSDGVISKFHPTGSDLPIFVNSTTRFVKEACEGTVSLETPVVYFYADKPMTATVRATFPTGVFTEWFPQAARPNDGRSLTWTDIRVRPGEVNPLPNAPGPNHYYAARDVDAAPLTVVKKSDYEEIHEHERFLFYRGVGDPKPPLTVSALGNGSFNLRTSAPIATGFILEVKAGRVRFAKLDSVSLAAASMVGLPPDWSTADSVQAALVPMLVHAGLFEKEARAMVKTWETAWFGDDGTRVLYILPTEWTARTLPLKVTPVPDALIRVMVGRHDVLTPEREREIDDLVKKMTGPAPNAANAEMAKLGRFAEPARLQAEKRLAQRN